MGCNDCKSPNPQGTQYCQECMPDEGSIIALTKTIPDPFLMDRNHLYLTPNGDTYILNYGRTQAQKLTGGNSSGGNTTQPKRTITYGYTTKQLVTGSPTGDVESFLKFKLTDEVDFTRDLLTLIITSPTFVFSMYDGSGKVNNLVGTLTIPIDYNAKSSMSLLFDNSDIVDLSFSHSVSNKELTIFNPQSYITIGRMSKESFTQPFNFFGKQPGINYKLGKRDYTITVSGQTKVELFRKRLEVKEV